MKKKITIVIQLIMICYLLITIAIPLFSMFGNIKSGDFVKTVTGRQFSRALKNSIAVSSVSTALSVFLAFLAAWCIARTNIRKKSIYRTLLSIPMLVPSISHSSGLVLLFGQNGVLTKFLKLRGSIYGFWGIVFGSVLYSFPFAFLMIDDILRYENYSPYEAADVLGIPRLLQVKDLTLSYLRKPFISIVFTVFSYVFTDYGIPITIGGKYMTLPTIMYQEVIGQLDFGKGSIIGVFLLIPAVTAFFIDMATRDRASSTYVNTPYQVKRGKARDFTARIFCCSLIIVISMIIMSFVVLSFTKQYPSDLTLTLTHVKKTIGMNGSKYLMNSLIISLFVAVLGTSFSFFIAIYSTRINTVLSKLLHVICIVSIAIPGIVLGLAYVFFFKGSILYGTFVLLVLVNITHFIASPYIMMVNTLRKINENIEIVGETLGVGRFRIIRDVLIPQTKSTLIEMVSYLFVNSMITISAISFLATTVNKPFSLMINQFEQLMIIECSAVVSILLLVTNGFIKIATFAIKKRLQEKDDKYVPNEITV